MNSGELQTLPSLENVELMHGLSGKARLQFLRVPLAKSILEAETVEEAGAALDVAMAQLDELDIPTESKTILMRCLHADYGGTIEDVLGS